MSLSMEPEPLLVERSLNLPLYQQALDAGLHPLQARILAGRLTHVYGQISQLVQPTLRSLASPFLLKDADRAADRLAVAIRQQEPLAILTDYDVDGITAHVVIHRALTEYFQVDAGRIQHFIGHRLQDGYGISDALVDRILGGDILPRVLLSADCGSADEARIQRLKAAGIDVIVTDHHLLPEQGPPASAWAVINPTRPDCDYPDKTLAGCAVAWLLMSALRQRLMEQQYLPDTTPKLMNLLTYVALGTVADCVSLGGSAINRALVQTGLQLMNLSQVPCWQAFRLLMGEAFRLFTVDTLAFQLGPRINARSRMADPYAALHFLLAENVPSAQHFLQLLDQDNQDRRAVERTMIHTARQFAQAQRSAGQQGLVIFLPEGHAGVQGIVASRLIEVFGCPSIVLTPADDPRYLSGSARSTEAVSLHELLQRLDRLYPGLMLRFGGHRAAAGLTLWRDKLADFQQAFNLLLRQQLGEQVSQPLLYTDGRLDGQLLTLDTWQLLHQLQPYGRDFELPVFTGQFRLLSSRRVGKDQAHCQLLLLEEETGQQLQAIWFRAPRHNAAQGQRVEAAYQLDCNSFRGQQRLQLQLRWLHPMADG